MILSDFGIDASVIRVDFTVYIIAQLCRVICAE